MILGKVRKTIEKSRWIEKFESELERKKVFCLYGSIDDDYFY